MHTCGRKAMATNPPLHRNVFDAQSLTLNYKAIKITLAPNLVPFCTRSHHSFCSKYPLVYSILNVALHVPLLLPLAFVEQFEAIHPNSDGHTLFSRLLSPLFKHRYSAIPPVSMTPHIPLNTMSPLPANHHRRRRRQHESSSFQQQPPKKKN